MSLSFRPNRRAFATGLAAALGSIALPRTGFAAEGYADTIVFNGQIATLSPHQPLVNAMAIRQGRILAIGDLTALEALAGPQTRRWDLGGRMVIPGLNDSHIHATRGGRFFATELRWDGVPSLETALSMVAEQARRTPSGQWVRVIGGWSPHQFAEKRMPTPAELTRAAPNTPVFVLYLYSGGFLNQAAIDALGITAQTVPPKGTRYEIGGDGKPTGRLIADPSPVILYQTISKLPPLGLDDQEISTRHWYRELNRFGLTSVTDPGGGGHRYPENYGGSFALADSGDLTLRVSNYLFPQNAGAELAEFQAWERSVELNENRAPHLHDGFVVRGGGEFLAWSAGDYENFSSAQPDITNRETWRRDLKETARFLVSRRWPIRQHATYGETIHHIMDVFEEVHREEILAGRPGFTGLRWAIDHAETADIAGLKRIKALGGGIAIQSRMAYAAEEFVERYGRKAARQTPPVRQMLDMGIPVGAGTDGTRVGSYHPWSALYWLHTGRSVGGLRHQAEENRLSRLEALKLYTAGSAWFSQEENRKGMLYPGQYADFAVLSDDYFSVEADRIPAIEAELTVLDGRPVYARGDFAEMVAPLPPLTPEWSPVNRFGGYYAG